MYLIIMQSLYFRGVLNSSFSMASGLSAPVPRGRKGKKGKMQTSQPHMPQADWLVDCNPDILLQEDSYKRHLKHHCNKYVPFHLKHPSSVESPNILQISFIWSSKISARY